MFGKGGMESEGELRTAEDKLRFEFFYINCDSQTTSFKVFFF